MVSRHWRLHLKSSERAGTHSAQRSHRETSPGWTFACIQVCRSSPAGTVRTRAFWLRGAYARRARSKGAKATVPCARRPLSVPSASGHTNPRGDLPVRVVWEVGGEQWIGGAARCWTQEAVFVAFVHERRSPACVWVEPEDLKRR